MKVFVWQGVLKDYTSGMVVVLAETVDQAREWCYEKWDLNPGLPEGVPKGQLSADPEIYTLPLDAPKAFVVWGGG